MNGAAKAAPYPEGQALADELIEVLNNHPSISSFDHIHVVGQLLGGMLRQYHHENPGRSLSHLVDQSTTHILSGIKQQGRMYDEG